LHKVVKALTLLNSIIERHC